MLASDNKDLELAFGSKYPVHYWVNVQDKNEIAGKLGELELVDPASLVSRATGLAAGLVSAAALYATLA